MHEMKQYLFHKAQCLLAASLKLIDICYDIQLLLQHSYPGTPMAFISPFHTSNSGTFMFCVMLHYIKSELDAPIYATRYAEKGVFDANCSFPEFQFQHYWKHFRKDNDLQAS